MISENSPALCLCIHRRLKLICRITNPDALSGYVELSYELLLRVGSRGMS